MHAFAPQGFHRMDRQNIQACPIVVYDLRTIRYRLKIIEIREVTVPLTNLSDFHLGSISFQLCS